MKMLWWGHCCWQCCSLSRFVNSVSDGVCKGGGVAVGGSVAVGVILGGSVLVWVSLGGGIDVGVSLGVSDVVGGNVAVGGDAAQLVWLWVLILQFACAVREL